MKNIKRKSIVATALTAAATLALGVGAIALINTGKNAGSENNADFLGSYDLTAYAATSIKQIAVDEKTVDITDTATFISTDEGNTYTLCLTVIDVDDLEGIATHLQVGYEIGESTYYNGNEAGLSSTVYSSLTFAGGDTLAASELYLGKDITNPYFIVAEVFTSVIGGNTSERIVSTAAHVWDDNVCTVCGKDAGGSKGLVMVLNEETDAYTLTDIGTCKDTDIVVPSTYNGLPVTELGFAAFEETAIKSITIPDSVTAIGDYAFYKCHSLESITISDSVTAICNGMFYDCYSLKSVTIPDSVTTIGEEAFCRCTALESVTLGKNSELTAICDEAFWYCPSLKSITIPDNVTAIGENAFYECALLISVTIGENSKLTTIGENAFSFCSSLMNITIPAGVTSIGDFAFYDCSRLVEVWNLTGTDGEDALNITTGSEDNGLVAYYAISVYTDAEAGSKLSTDEEGYVAYCDGTENILVNYVGKGGHLTIPDYITQLNNSALSGCTSIKSVIIPEGITSIAQEAFFECTSLISVKIPDSVTTIGDNAFGSCFSLTGITIPAGVTSIGSFAFYDCSKLVEVWDLTGTDGVDALNVTAGSIDNGFLGYYAKNIYTDKAEVSKTYADENGYIIYVDGKEKWLLGYIGDQTQLILPDGISRIYDSAFYADQSITSIIIPEGVTTIDNGAFSACASLETISIPDSVTSVGNAFNESESLTFSEYKGAKYLGNETHPYLILVEAADDEITSCEVHEGTKLILSNAFSYVSSLTDITIPDSVTTINEEAFYGCESLESVTIGANSKLTTIGTKAFSYCISLKGIAIPDSVTTIGELAFANCSLLESVTIGADSQLTTIGENAFTDCSSLTAITIPAGVTYIGTWAFYYCTSLKSVTFADNSQLTTLKNIFFNCSVLESISFGANSQLTTINEYAFGQCTSLKNITIPDGVTSIAEYAFYRCHSLGSVTIGKVIPTIQAVAFYDCNISTVYYKGTESDWSTYSAKIGDDNGCLTGATRYYYSENEPAVNEEGAYDGNFWHYADGVVTVWKK